MRIRVKRKNVFRITLMLMGVIFCLLLSQLSAFAAQGGTGGYSGSADTRENQFALVPTKQEATLLSGVQINVALKGLANGGAAKIYTSNDTNITGIVYTDTIDDSQENKIEIQDNSTSTVPVYAWYDAGTIYFSSTAEKIYLNESAEFMFQYMKSLQNISGLSVLDTSSCTSMRNMFVSTKIQNVDALKDWDTSQVKRMDQIFYSCSALESLDGVKAWKVNQVQDLSYAFSGCSKLTSLNALKQWDISQVEDLSYTFSGCTQLSTLAGIEDWNVGKVKKLIQTFSSCSMLTSLEALEKWNIGTVEDISWMLAYCSKLTNLTGLGNWNTEKVKTMTYAFAYCSELTDLNGIKDWKVSSVTDMSQMFTSDKKMKDASMLSTHTVEASDETSVYTAWEPNASVIEESIFGTSGIGRSYYDGSVELSVFPDWFTDAVTFMDGETQYASMRVPIYAASKGIPAVYLPEDPAKTGGEFLGWNLESDGSGDYFAAGETVVQEDTILYAVWKETKIAMLPKGTTFNTSLKTLSAGEYAGYYRTDNKLDVIQRSTSADEMEGRDVAELQASGEAVYAWVVKDVLYYYTEADTIYMNENSTQMFSGFSSLADISGLSYFDASNVTTGDDMFEGCNSLTNVDAMSGWNTGNMESARSMFSSCGSLSDISGLAKWDVSSVTDFGGFLYKTKISNLSPLKNWNLSSCENLSGFFNECYYITDLKPLAAWDVSKVTGIDSMFAETSIVNLSGLEKWDVSSVVMVEEMLYQCTSLKDVSAIAGWNAENFQRLRCLCSGCGSLKDASALSSWKIDSTLSNERMQFAFSDTGITDASLYPTWYYDYVSPVSAASVLTLDGNEGLVNGVSQINITAVDSSDEEILYEELEDESQDI